MSNSAVSKWTGVYQQHNMAYPAEYVIRIFKGIYPKLNFDKSKYPSQKILDIGAGDGSNLALLRTCGFQCFGVEISQEIVEKGIFNLSSIGINDIEMRVGNNANIPYKDNYFDFILSWNACYYMGKSFDFQTHVKEFSRVLNSGATCVMSIPKKSCFIYKGCDLCMHGNEQYAIIRNDPFNIRNGETLKIFNDEKDIEEQFSSEFESFTFGSIHDDCFGYDYHWHLVLCKKKK